MAFTALLAVVPVADLDSAGRWYENLFGRPADRRPMDSLAEWQVNEQAVVQVFHEPARAGQTLVNLTVDDLDSTLAELGGRGITGGEPQLVASGRQRLVVLADPDGNRVGLIESLAK